MSLFAKKKNINNVEVDSRFPEYHKCPVCGELVKTKPNIIENYKQKYLDGQRKISFETLMNCYHCCEKCGYVYILYDYSKNTNAKDVIKDIVYSDIYRNILNDNNIEENEKKLHLLTEIAKCGTATACNVNVLWLMFYEEKQDAENIKKYLSKRINDVFEGNVFSGSAVNGELCFEFYKGDKIHIEKDEILIDLYRRNKEFDKAKKIIDEKIKEYSLSTNSSIKKYYEYQLNLVRNNDNRHI